MKTGQISRRIEEKKKDKHAQTKDMYATTQRESVLLGEEELER